jgi:hypothetical protein
MKLSSSSTLTCIEVMHINQEKRREENELNIFYHNHNSVAYKLLLHTKT